MLISTFSFALMTFFVKLVPRIPSYEIVFFRSLVSLVLTLGALSYQRIPPFGNNKKWLLMRGGFGLVALTMFFTALQNIPLATAVTLQNLSPIFTAVFGIFLLKEAVKGKQWLFFAISFVGVVLIKGFDARVDTFYFVLALLSALFAGLAYNCVRKLRDSDHPLVIVFYFPLMATPVMVLLMLLWGYVWPTTQELLYMILIGIFTQFGQYFMTKALQQDKVARIAPLKYLGVVYALGFGYFYFGEGYGWMSMLGIILVVSGVLLNLGPSRLRPAKAGSS